MKAKQRWWLYLAVAGAPLSCLGQATISTVAGTGAPGFSGDGGPAASARIGGTPLNVAVDNTGNLLIVDGSNNRIRRVSGSGIISTVAGGGTGGLGDGGPATSAQIFPGGVAADSQGNLYIAQGALVRKVNAGGIISTVAGNGSPAYSGDGGPARNAGFLATSVAVDGAGNLYISDTIAQRIRKVDPGGTITTFAGTGAQGFSGDGGPATSAALGLPQGLATDRAGNVYFADALNGRVRKVDTAGTITTVAGNGTPISIGDGGPATGAGMTPTWVAVDNDGNLYICDTGGGRIRKVNTAGTISTLAGGGTPGTLGDGGPANRAWLSNPTGVAVDAAGNVYIADANNFRIRKVGSGAPGSPIQATPSTLSFSYTVGGSPPPGQTVVAVAIGATLTYTATTSAAWLSVSPASGNLGATLTISVDPSGLSPGAYNGTVTLTPSGAGNTPLNIPVLLSVNAPVTQGVISTVAGNGLAPFSGDGGPAVNAGLLAPLAVALDRQGNLYIADANNNRIRKVDTSGTINTIAGNGDFAFGGDGGPAASGSLFTPSALAVDSGGNVYIADTLNYRVRKVTPGGTISTFAGNGQPGYGGDGGQAASAQLFNPLGVALDPAGNLYISAGGTIRKVTPAGIISTYAGGFLLGFSGDGGAATSATFLLPSGLAFDPAGNLYIADTGNHRIRKVSTAGIVSTVAGTGTRGFSGDGGPAASAQLQFSSGRVGLAFDPAGNLYISDVGNHRVRKIDTSGTISTVAGNGIAGFSGDGNPATTAGLNNPSDVAVDAAGDLYIADTTNLRVRKVTFGSRPGAPSISANGVVNGASLQPGIVANSWATILGSNLSAKTATWDNAVVNGRLPATLEGVSVSVGGKPAYIYYISPGQINFVAPDVPAGPAQVTVTSGGQTSASFTVTVSAYGPAFFAWPENQAVATHPDYSWAVKDGTFAGASTAAAKPGEVITLWGTGFGPTIPAAPAGVQVPGDRIYSTSTAPEVTINNVPATVFGAALTPGNAGLYQIAIQVPVSLPDGEWPVRATIGGVSSPAGIVLAVRK